MGACATKPGDLKVKGEAPLVVEDAAAAPPPTAAADEKAKAGEAPVGAAAEVVDHADVSRRRSLSVLLKQDAEASDVEADADHQEAEKVVDVAEEPASGAGGGAGETTMGSAQAPVQASVATATEHDDTVEEPKNDDLPSGGDAQAAEEEKRVDPESVQVAAATDADAAAAAAAADAAPSSEESKVADSDDASA